jgi:hypothetical protein
VLAYAVRVKLLDESPAALVPNPEPKRQEVPVFESIGELEAVAAELLPAYRAIPIAAGLTGLRPEELDRARTPRRRSTRTCAARPPGLHDGRVKLYGKQERSLRSVPLRGRAVQALSEHPARLDTPLLFPMIRGASHIELDAWRGRHWAAAVKAGGLAKRPPYATETHIRDLRNRGRRVVVRARPVHGASVEQIDETYGHPLPDARERTRNALYALVARSSEAVWGVNG